MLYGGTDKIIWWHWSCTQFIIRKIIEKLPRNKSVLSFIIADKEISPNMPINNNTTMLILILINWISRNTKIKQ